ncbi:MAG: oligosaccharide flippase family protein [Chlorobiaceae bacterium]|nr:oligosaccharide flippase family protein [Chlorobiaceae bacterium]
MAFTPFITRLYGPVSYGLQGLFISVVSLLSIVAALSYPTAIVLPRSDIDAKGIARLSIYTGIGVTMLTSIVLYFVGDNVLKLMNAGEISAFEFLIPVTMLVTVFASVLSQWLIRKKAFELTARYAIINALLVNLAKVVMGLIYPTALMLIATNLAVTVLGTVLTYLAWLNWHSRQRVPDVTEEPATKLFELARRHYDFPLLRTPQNLINAFSQSLPLILLAIYFSAGAAGQYSIALAVLSVPSALIGGSVMSVFYPKINEAFHKGENTRKLIVNVTGGMAATGAIPFMIVMLFGPELFQLVFGEAWRSSGIYAQLLSPWLFLQYINKPSISAIPALGIQHGLLIYEIFSTGTKILALWFGFSIYHNPVVAIGLFSFAGSIAYIWLILWVIRKSGEQSIKKFAIS